MDIGLERYFSYIHSNYLLGASFVLWERSSLQLVLGLPITKKWIVQGNVIISYNWGFASKSLLPGFPLSGSLCVLGMCLYVVMLVICLWWFFSYYFLHLFCIGLPEWGRQVEWISPKYLGKITFVLSVSEKVREYNFLVTPSHLKTLLKHLRPFCK